MTNIKKSNPNTNSSTQERTPIRENNPILENKPNMSNKQNTKPKFNLSVYNPMIEKMHLPTNAVLEAHDVRKAIMGVTTTWSGQISNKAFLETDGLLGKAVGD